MVDKAKNQATLFPASTLDYAVTANGKHGFGLVAKRNIKKGKLVFSSSLEYAFSQVAAHGDYLLFYRNELASMETKSNVPPRFPLTHQVLCRTHGVPILKDDPTGQTDGIISWQLEIPGLLMNHSCHANVHNYPDSSCSSEEHEDYAERTIHKGEELTFDYALQYYDVGPLFEVCTCGASNCRGEMMGFKSLSDADKERLLPLASDAV